MTCSSLCLYLICGDKRYGSFSRGPSTWQRLKEENGLAKALLSELGIRPSTNSSECPHQSLNTDDKVSPINTRNNRFTNNFLGFVFFFFNHKTNSETCDWPNKYWNVHLPVTSPAGKCTVFISLLKYPQRRPRSVLYTTAYWMNAQRKKFSFFFSFSFFVIIKKKNQYTRPGMWVHTFGASTWEKQMGLWEFRASLL